MLNNHSSVLADGFDNDWCLIGFEKVNEWLKARLRRWWQQKDLFKKIETVTSELPQKVLSSWIAMSAELAVPRSRSHVRLHRQSKNQGTFWTEQRERIDVRVLLASIWWYNFSFSITNIIRVSEATIISKVEVFKDLHFSLFYNTISHYNCEKSQPTFSLIQ